MITNLILACIAITIFIAYNIVIIKLFGIPSSLSDSYYLLNKKWKHGGIAFTIMMWIVCGLLIIPWLEVTEIISNWSKYLTILPFATITCLLFVATAPNFRDGELPHNVHMTCAKLTAVFAILWICIVCWKIAYILPAWILVIGGVAHLTKTAKSARDYWLEMVAFGATFTTLITELALHI